VSQHTPTRKLRLALQYLRELITQGVEFPDAHFQTSHSYHLTEQQDRELVELYDTTESGHEREHGGAGTTSAATTVKSHSERR
jgi:hypothetical protein